MPIKEQKKEKKTNGFKISGRILEKESGEGLPNLTVKAVDKDLFFDDLLGTATTDEKGYFEITYDKEDFRELFFDKKPDIYLKVKSPKGEVLISTESTVKYEADKTEEFMVLVPQKKYLKILFKFEVHVMRPKDMVNLKFTFYNLKLKDGNLVRLNNKSSAYMVVEFPPQNIAEEAFFETDPKYPIPAGKPGHGETTDPFPPVSLPVDSRISGNSRLVFRVPNDDKIPYSISGFLEKCSQYSLRVAPTALPPDAQSFKKKILNLNQFIQRMDILKYSDAAAFGKDETLSFSTDEVRNYRSYANAWTARSGLTINFPQSYDIEFEKSLQADFYEFELLPIKPELRRPTHLETSIEAPYRLLISPNRYAAWAHSPQPVTGASSQRVELWHTRHAIRSNGAINEQDKRLRTIRAIWTKDWFFQKRKVTDCPPHSNFPFRMTLDSFDRHNLVHLSANYFIGVDDRNKYNPLPVQVERLMLTSLGAWLNVHGLWEPPPMLSVEEWRHRSTLGRDHYVRVVYKGFLGSPGNRASLVKVTERKFHPEITTLIWGAVFQFVQRIDSEVKTLESKSNPEMNTFKNAINANFDKEISDLVASIEGKSPDEINALVESSKQKFHKKTTALADHMKEENRKDMATIANTALESFSTNAESLVKIVEGISFPQVPGNIAFLRQRMFIVVKEPERIFVSAGIKNPAGHLYDLQWPFTRIQITTLVTPNLDDPANSDYQDSQNNDTLQSLFWPKVGGELFLFHIIAEDLAGNQIEFNTPLVFIDQSLLNYRDAGGNPSTAMYNEMKALLEKVHIDYQNNLSIPMNGQSIMFADSNEPGKTTFETQSLILGAEIPNDYNDFHTLKANYNNQDIPPFYPTVEKANVFIPSIKNLAGVNQSTDISYHHTYLLYGFDGNQNKGEVFVQLGGNGLGLDFNSQGDRSGGMVKPNMQIKSLSRIMGPVAGNSTNGIATGDFNPTDFFAGLDAKIFGVINLWDIIKTVVFDTLSNEKVPKITTDIDPVSQKLEVTLKWEPQLQDWNNIFIAKNGSKDAKLTMLAKLTLQASGEGETVVDISCKLEDFSIDLIGSIQSFIIIRFDELEFKSQGGKKADIDVKLANIEFVGVLAFVEALKKYIPLDGFSDPPSLDVTSEGIVAGYSLTLPDFAIGIFSLENVSLGASFTLPFNSDPLSVRFNFCERQSPFLLTVSMFGGGGFFAITINPKGVQSLEASFEFGASISVNFGVASGGVYIMAGIYFKMETTPEEKAALTGYFRMGGEVDVLGIISASIELYLSLTYEFTSGKCVGKATLTIEVRVLFFSASVEISCEKKFAGSNGDPTFEQLMSPYPDPYDPAQDIFPWEIYCQAFA